MKELFIIALAISAVSFTIAVTSIFSWLRELISLVHSKLEELIHCPWCLSHWILGILMIVLYNFSTYQPINISGILILDYIFNSFAMICISGLGHYVLLRTYEPLAKMLVQRQLEKLKSNKKS